MNELTVYQVVTFAFAMVGAVLGVLNTWRNFRLDSVRLRVRPKHVIIPSDHTDYVGISVVNTGAVAVTLVDVGFQLGRRLGKKKYASVAMALGYNSMSSTLPQKLEPRESATYIFPRSLLSDFSNERIFAAYTRTTCDETRTGRSPALSQF